MILSKILSVLLFPMIHMNMVRFQIQNDKSAIRINAVQISRNTILTFLGFLYNKYPPTLPFTIRDISYELSSKSIRAIISLFRYLEFLHFDDSQRRVLPRYFMFSSTISLAQMIMKIHQLGKNEANVLIEFKDF
jgi:hypothetical protein